LIRDSFGRPVLNFRVAVTQKCNLRCPFCHREGEDTATGTEMTPEEIARITGIAASLGITKVKLTGGEPLIRNDIAEIARKVSQIPTIEDLAMTTNGVLLREKAEEVHANGVKRLNISFVSLDAQTYEKVTKGRLEKTLAGIREAARVGFYPIKLNMVILKDVNENEVDRMIQFSRENGLILQLIELEPINVDMNYYSEHHQNLSRMEERLKNEAISVQTRTYMQNRRVYSLPGVKVEVVNPIENTEFCAHCTRLRLTSDGKLKPCLMREDNLVDLLTPLRAGADDAALTSLFVRAVERREPFFKPARRA
jgi:cyclic pyranopterin phosphate synthase